MTVLLIDADHDGAEMMPCILAGSISPGHRFEGADGPPARPCASALCRFVRIVHSRLPGTTVLGGLRADYATPQIRVYLMSSLEPAGADDLAGAFNLIPKPFDPRKRVGFVQRFFTVQMKQAFSAGAPMVARPSVQLLILGCHPHSKIRPAIRNVRVVTFQRHCHAENRKRRQ